MMRLLIIISLLILTPGSALANICVDYKNPCEESKDCTAASDFVIETKLGAIHERPYVEYGRKLGAETKLSQHKTLSFNVTGWLKGKPLHDPALLEEFPMSEDICSNVVTIKPELEPGKKYRIYGVYHGSENHCKIYSAHAVKSCMNHRRELRKYLLIEPITELSPKP